MRKRVPIVIVVAIACGSWLISTKGKMKRPGRDATHTRLPAKKRVRDALDRGSELRWVDPSELAPEFRAKLLDVCTADSNVAGLWLVWLSSGDSAPELLPWCLTDAMSARFVISSRERMRLADRVSSSRFRSAFQPPSRFIGDPTCSCFDRNEPAAERNHWSECGRGTSVGDAEALGRPHRSVLAFGGIPAMKLFLLLAVAAVLVGCRMHSMRTADQFAFLEVGMPLSVVTNRVGTPDRSYRGQIRLAYDLADGSEMNIVSDGGETRESWRVTWFGQRRGDKWLWAKPPEVLK